MCARPPPGGPISGQVPVTAAVVGIVLALAGCAAYLWRLARDGSPTRADERGAVVLCGLALAGSVAGYVWWNLSFVQHQGRYLFPAIGAIAGGVVVRRIGRGCHVIPAV